MYYLQTRPTNISKQESLCSFPFCSLEWDNPQGSFGSLGLNFLESQGGINHWTETEELLSLNRHLEVNFRSTWGKNMLYVKSLRFGDLSVYSSYSYLIASLMAQRVKKNCLWGRRPGFDPWVRKIPWRRKWQPTPIFLPGESHGQRCLAGYSQELP